MHIDEKTFTNAIEAIRVQTLKDKNYALHIETLFNAEMVSVYDNSDLVKTIIKLLQVAFPRDADGFCEI
jgi:hypothetical protein